MSPASPAHPASPISPSHMITYQGHSSSSTGGAEYLTPTDNIIIGIVVLSMIIVSIILVISSLKMLHDIDKDIKK